MLERLRGLVGRPGPVGALAVGVLVGVATGLLALNLVLAGWTFRDAARRDLQSPGRWALAVLVAGPLGLAPYVAIQTYRDRKQGAVRGTEPPVPRDRPAEDDVPVSDAESAGRGLDGVETAGRGSDDAESARPAAVRTGAAAQRDAPSRRGASLAGASLRYGAKAAVLAGRSARWAARRAAARMNND